jgi:hypothetical protein
VARDDAPNGEAVFGSDAVLAVEDARATEEGKAACVTRVVEPSRSVEDEEGRSTSDDGHDGEGTLAVVVAAAAAAAADAEADAKANEETHPVVS